MKKILAISALFLTIPTFLTGCGVGRDDKVSESGYYSEHGDRDDRNNRDESSDMGRNDREDHPVRDGVNDAIDGVESAADDVVDGVGDAANDIVDGLDGERETSENSDTNDNNTDTTNDNAR